ncbi:MAG: phosphate signaling complex protein PhoU [Helicobacteraceae bacterium]|jgi:phosphate transport system protein|nr:phosphate signaling complex protein PhoU [Helicobacteraceae bacterium]
MMRRNLDEQLSRLDSNMIEMGALIVRAITRATKALQTRDLSAAAGVIEGDDLIDDKEREIESLCLKLLLRQQPVAGDLRQVSSALKMITDMERIADQAADISELCGYLTDRENCKNMAHILQMAEHTIQMVTDSVKAYVDKDIELARAVIDRDDMVDSLYLVAKKDTIELARKDPLCGEEAIDALQIAKYYERIGDHAVNIAEWVIFSIAGTHKNRRVL